MITQDPHCGSISMAIVTKVTLIFKNVREVRPSEKPKAVVTAPVLFFRSSLCPSVPTLYHLTVYEMLEFFKKLRCIVSFPPSVSLIKAGVWFTSRWTAAERKIQVTASSCRDIWPLDAFTLVSWIRMPWKALPREEAEGCWGWIFFRILPINSVYAFAFSSFLACYPSNMLSLPGVLCFNLAGIAIF